MNTRRILLVTNDGDLKGNVKISAMTLTKLNCQVTIDEVADLKEALSISASPDVDMVIVDAVGRLNEASGLISSIRNGAGSRTKKIIALCGSDEYRQEIFNAGCDSIFTKEEFRKAMNNILQI